MKKPYKTISGDDKFHYTQELQRLVVKTLEIFFELDDEGTLAKIGPGDRLEIIEEAIGGAIEEWVDRT